MAAGAERTGDPGGPIPQTAQAAIDGGVPAALTCGLVAGVAAVATLRSTAGRTETTDAMAPAPPAALPDQPA